MTEIHLILLKIQFEITCTLNTDTIFQNYITHVYYKMDRQLMGEVSVENRNGH